MHLHVVVFKRRDNLGSKWGVVVSDEFGSMRIEVVVVHFKIISQHFPGNNEETQEKIRQRVRMNRFRDLPNNKKSGWIYIVNINELYQYAVTISQ
jgi:hypothetical protein